MKRRSRIAACLLVAVVAAVAVVAVAVRTPREQVSPEQAARARAKLQALVDDDERVRQLAEGIYESSQQKK